MKRFVWRLQRVLDIKTKEEHIVKAQLVKLTEKLIGVRSELLVQKGILNNLISDISEESPKARLGKQELFLKCSKTNSEIIKKLTEKVNELVLAQKIKNAEVVKGKPELPPAGTSSRHSGWSRNSTIASVTLNAGDTRHP